VSKGIEDAIEMKYVAAVDEASMVALERDRFVCFRQHIECRWVKR
jgi:hypothetical protein